MSNYSPESVSFMPWRRITIAAIALAALSLLAIGALGARDAFLMRGIPVGLPADIPQGGARMGINIYLDGLSDVEQRAELAAIKAAGLTAVKQSFTFSESYDWAATDRFMDAVTAEDLTLIPLLDGDPATHYAPPADRTAFAEWAGEFAARYGEQLTAYIIWDEPNLTSHWGNRAVNPNEYAALLSAAAAAIRASDPDAVIVAAPLAPTTERSGNNLADPLYLAALYRAGAGSAFDVVSSKPYGFDTGPDDRVVSIDQLNFSRPILLREIMIANGDGHKAVWAGNWGWNSLPAGWSGEQSIWGQTSEEQQAAWTIAGLTRAQREWPWMGYLFLENWTPGAAGNDPRWGFSIAARPTATVLAEAIAAQSPNVAMPGFHPARADDPTQIFVGDWEFAPGFGADIGQSGDKVRFMFWGTDVGVKVRRSDFRARFYATVDGQPANALPRDEHGVALVLTAADPGEDYFAIEQIARNLPPGIHTLELEASRGWDQWALAGFSAGYRPAGLSRTWQPALLGLLALMSLTGAFYSARRANWGEFGRLVRQRFGHLSDHAQLLLTGAAAALVTLTGWLTWGEDALGIYRRLGDGGQLLATAAAATVFYVTPSFIIFTTALLALFILLTLRPAWGLALIVLTTPFYVPPLPKPILGFQFSPVEVFTLVTAAAWFTRSAFEIGSARRRGRVYLNWPRPRRTDWAVLAFIAVATASLFFPERLGVALSEWRVVIIEPALFYLLLRAIKPSAHEMWVVLDSLLLSGLIIAGYGLWQYVSGQDLITAEGGLLRLRSIYGSPNNVALYLDRLLPLLIAMWLLGTRVTHGRRRSLYAAAIAPIGVALLLTFSKGALFLGIPASLLFILWVWRRRTSRRTWTWVLGFALLGVTIFAVASRISVLTDRLNLFGVTGVFRIQLWQSAVNMFIDHPWFGVGLDNFLYAYRGRYILEAAWQEPNLSHPHNIILDFATRLGILGLLAGGWMIWQTIQELIRALLVADPEWLPVAVGMGGALVAMLAHGIVDHSLFLVDLSFLFFLITGVLVWLNREEQTKSPSPAE